ncbi:DUF2299 family protein [Sulfuracidifex metallicus]|uniref:DUF2299 family protein n=1 Tax=Sulfuracidifex metallicus TaxID=47303 RepID=UPI002273F99A|nr:DUF2299 family protein [Sulfuracidifex metallicus]MCY0849437.1 DUF2299 family protein [Sulfuracidifex metallicus]
MDDEKVEELFKSLNMKTFRPSQAQEFFHISVSPPQGGPVVDIVKLKKESNFYIIIMGIQIAQEHYQKLSSMKPEEAADFLLEIQKNILLQGIEIAFLPIGQEIPQIIQLSKAVFDVANENEFLDSFTKVKNSGIYIMLSFSVKLGRVQAQGKGHHFI